MKRGIVVIALAAMPVFADEVHLRGGGRVTGEIVERTADSVTVDIGGGTLTARMSSVVRIEMVVSPLQEYRKRAGTIPVGNAEKWRELARWATGRTVSRQASEAYSRVVAILPDDSEANRALGRVELDGKWVTEEESYLARGFVEFEGEWMKPAEQRAILEERRVQEEADRQAMAAQIQIEDDAAMERLARKKAEHDAFWHDSLPKMGDPVLLGWGSGLETWPTLPVQQPRPERPVDSPAGGQP